MTQATRKLARHVKGAYQQSNLLLLLPIQSFIHGFATLWHILYRYCTPKTFSLDFSTSCLVPSLSKWQSQVTLGVILFVKTARAFVASRQPSDQPSRESESRANATAYVVSMRMRKGQGSYSKWCSEALLDPSSVPILFLTAAGTDSHITVFVEASPKREPPQHTRHDNSY